ncbi:MAG TPA: hypothetical protein VNX25_06295, partial [Verrucomicrobiae bacterium]|nr:hypothetical protein [Verrucomicrobiae bacterium]
MPAPLRVCLLTTAYPTWNEGHGRIIRGKFVHDMAKYLVRGGAEVHVVTQREENTPEYEERDGVGIHRFRYFLNGHETLTTGAGIPENIKKLRNKLLVPFYVGALAGTALRVMRSHGVGVINAHWGVP